ncbi:hypothetical protein ACTFIY_000989 [Dictyostelium cf. discoideum]
MSIDINFTINDILYNQDSLQKKNKYTCQICFEFIYKKQIYQCKSGHHACQQCWEKSLKSKKECMSCRLEVNSISDLSRCLMVEQDFGKKECCCIYSFNEQIVEGRNSSSSPDGASEQNQRKLIKDEENGCKEKIEVDQIESHFINCQYKFVTCSFKGCEMILRMNSLETHQNECGFKLVTCDFCERDDIKKMELETHYNVCPMVPIDCPQGCILRIERKSITDHIENDCCNTQIPCKYFEQGCKVEMKRSELQNHLETVNHQTYMGILIDKLTNQVNYSKKTHDELLKKIEDLSLLIIKFNENCLKKQVLPKAMEICTNGYRNKWIISNYSSVAKSKLNCQALSSPILLILSHLFQVCIYPRGDENKDYISLYLRVNNIEEPNSLKVEYSFTLVNVLDRTKSITKKEDKKVFISPEGWGWGKFLLSDSINKENGWLSNDDKLTIEIYIKILNEEYEPLES